MILGLDFGVIIEGVCIWKICLGCLVKRSSLLHNDIKKFMTLASEFREEWANKNMRGNIF